MKRRSIGSWGTYYRENLFFIEYFHVAIVNIGGISAFFSCCFVVVVHWYVASQLTIHLITKIQITNKLQIVREITVDEY